MRCGGRRCAAGEFADKVACERVIVDPAVLLEFVQGRVHDIGRVASLEQSVAQIDARARLPRESPQRIASRGFKGDEPRERGSALHGPCITLVQIERGDIRSANGRDPAAVHFDGAEVRIARHRADRGDLA